MYDHDQYDDNVTFPFETVTLKKPGPFFFSFLFFKVIAILVS